MRYSISNYKRSETGRDAILWPLVVVGSSFLPPRLRLAWPKLKSTNFNESHSSGLVHFPHLNSLLIGLSEGSLHALTQLNSNQPRLDYEPEGLSRALTYAVRKRIEMVEEQGLNPMKANRWSMMNTYGLALVDEVCGISLGYE